MRRVGFGLALLCIAFGTVTASAQDKYPSKPVKIVVPYAPGGATDIVARILGDQLRQITGQSFVVENKPGANGIVAINEMVNAKPDGYTLMIGNVTTNTITPCSRRRRCRITTRTSWQSPASSIFPSSWS